MKPDFNKAADGLVPAVVQDANTLKVLMLGYMNEAALERTLSEKRVCFYSRSKKRLWTKGEESGNFLELNDLFLDCDNDTILVKARPAGPVCHKGTATCFSEDMEGGVLDRLEQLIISRKRNPAEGSYVSGLFASGINKIAQKVGEEATELVIEAKDNNKEAFENEAADLLFHYLVLLAEKDCRLSDVLEVLQERSTKKPEKPQKR